MKFETLYERFRAGPARPVEAERVEEELAKYRLLTDYVAEHDELDLPGGPETGEERGEVRRVRQAVRRVRAGTVLVAFVLVLLALLAWRFAAVPLLNRYVLYDPTADGDNYLDSLELEVAVLESLHFPEWSSQTVYAQETGLGSYDLTLYESDLAAGEWTATKGTMDLADIRFEEDFYRRWVAINQFTRGTYPYYATEQVPGHSPEETAAALAELPDYLDATLSLSFARDLSMEEFAGLAGRYPDLRFQWVGVRINDGERRQLLPLAGFDAAGLSMLGAEEDEERYPFLWLPLHREDSDLGKVYTGHFLALLGYQAERAVLAEKIGGPAGSYYRDALRYVEENGAYTYGVYVSGRPETLAALCGEAEAEWVGIESLRLSARFES